MADFCEHKTWRYPAKVIRVIDGDTIEAELTADLGFNTVIKFRQTFRLLGIDAPEMHGVERPLGIEAKKFLEDLISSGPVIIESHKSDHFGRYLADVFVGDMLVNQQLVVAGHARLHGKK